jgi:hypothetical protein
VPNAKNVKNPSLKSYPAMLNALPAMNACLKNQKKSASKNACPVLNANRRNKISNALMPVKR